ncbi:hypothetical protein [Allorhodopirellula solitaria]|uniref:hypothetical protein n=1 Tax=Allorhodopirellula solitaria TaxID=2527987 RepID=UPI0011B53A66|nr:hypothetical protein [Allorhodopirellula solitaria]
MPPPTPNPKKPLDDEQLTHQNSPPASLGRWKLRAEKIRRQPQNLHQASLDEGQELINQISLL